MLIACQDCQQFSGYFRHLSFTFKISFFSNSCYRHLGEAFRHVIFANKDVFYSLLQELETGDDLKLKVPIPSLNTPH